MSWFNFGRKKEIRQADTAPHKEISTDICTQTSAGLALLDRLYNLKGYSPFNQSAFFAAVNLITNSVAQMSWELKSYGDEDPDQSFIRNIGFECELTQFMFVKNIIKDCIIHGNGYGYIHRDSKGYPISLEYLPYGQCSFFYNQVTKTLLYQASNINNGKMIEPINIIHIRMITDDGITGIPLTSYAKNIIKINGAAEQAASKYFEKGMRLQGILSTDNPSLSEKSRKNILESWLKSGEGMNGTAVLEAGMHYQPITSNSKDAQLLETRLFNVQEIARFFNMSPTLLGDLSKTSYNTLEASQQAFVLNSLMPYVTMLEQELNMKLLSYNQRQNLYIDIKESDIIKSDKNSQANYLTTLVNSGLITRNEARKELGFNPIEGGDILTVSYTDINQNTIGGEQENTESNTTDKNNENKENEEQ